MNRLPLSPLTLEAVQGAAIRAAHLHPELDQPTVATLAQLLGKVADHCGPLLDTEAADPLVGALLDLAAQALRWVEQIDGDGADSRATRVDLAAAVSAAPTPLCAWWAMCTNLATGTRTHPILGQVPICDRCNTKVERLGGAR